MKWLPCGDDAVLLDCVDADERRRWMAHLTSNPPRGVVDAVPASTSILLRFGAPTAMARFLEAASTRRPAATEAGATPGELLRIKVRYDGVDVDDVCARLGWRAADLIAWHTGQEWVCDFVGFLPGFGYLVGEKPLDIPRRPTPRVEIPRGAVALAGVYSGIYPSASPGGWQLIGTADVPAPYPAGTRIRFEAVR